MTTTRFGAIDGSVSTDGVVPPGTYARRARLCWSLGTSITVAKRLGTCRPLVEAFVPANDPNFAQSLEEDRALRPNGRLPMREKDGQRYVLCRSILDKATLSYRRGKNQNPEIFFGGETIETEKSSGEASRMRFAALSILSETSKMACPSFSLPAGAPLAGGSCISASARDPRRVEGKTYICDECYSLGKAYIYPNVQLAQMARQAWVCQNLVGADADAAIAVVSDAMIDAIRTFAGSIPYNKNAKIDRLLSEIGIWNKKRGVIEMPYRRTFLDIQPTPLPPETGFADTRAFFADRNPEAGETVGFFRIHDSGDFTIGAGDDARELRRRYVRAWVRTAQQLPNIMFWAPTRVADPTGPATMFKELTTAMKNAPNLIIRPSALHVDDAPPRFGSFPAGSGVSAVTGKGRERSLVPMFDALGQRAWECPAYSEKGKEENSCLAAGCRTCWIRPSVPVTYGEH